MASRCKTVLITGAATRVGRRLALDMAAQGWRIGVHYRRSETAAAETIDAIVKAGGIARGFRADLADIDQARALIGHCAEALGAPECLVNNASLFEDDAISSMSPQGWQAHMDVNCRAPVFLAQAFAAALPAGREGNIVNIIDQRVLRPSPEFFSYTASKAALWAATRTMAQALAPRIRVNAIGPGPVLQSVHQAPEEFQRECEETLLRRGVDAADIAAAVRFILGAPSLTGQLIALDSGQHLA